MLDSCHELNNWMTHLEILPVFGCTQQHFLRILQLCAQGNGSQRQVMCEGCQIQEGSG